MSKTILMFDEEEIVDFFRINIDRKYTGEVSVTRAKTKLPNERYDIDDLQTQTARINPDLLVIELYYFRRENDIRKALEQTGVPYILFTTTVSPNGRKILGQENLTWGFNDENIPEGCVFCKPWYKKDILEAITRLIF